MSATGNDVASPSDARAAATADTKQRGEERGIRGPTDSQIPLMSLDILVSLHIASF